eukprot:11210957-Lingulodinium_polyedra.AAC.1
MSVGPGLAAAVRHSQDVFGMPLTSLNFLGFPWASLELRTNTRARWLGTTPRHRARLGGKKRAQPVGNA